MFISNMSPRCSEAVVLMGLCDAPSLLITLYCCSLVNPGDLAFSIKDGIGIDSFSNLMELKLIASTTNFSAGTTIGIGIDTI